MSVNHSTKPISEVIHLDGYVFKVLFPDLTRTLTPNERKGLKASIQASGILLQVFIDETGGIIDGINRLTIASELSLSIKQIPCTVVKDLTLEQKRALAVSLNAERRHLELKDLKQLRIQRNERILRVTSLRKEGMSLRAIAEKENISVAQVNRDLELMTYRTGGTPLPENGKVIGKDGKKRRAKTSPSQPFTETIQKALRPVGIASLEEGKQEAFLSWLRQGQTYIEDNWQRIIRLWSGKKRSASERDIILEEVEDWKGKPKKP